MGIMSLAKIGRATLFRCSRGCWREGGDCRPRLELGRNREPDIMKIMPYPSQEHPQCGCKKRSRFSKIRYQEGPEIAKGWLGLSDDGLMAWFHPNSELSESQIPLIQSGKPLSIEVIEPRAHVHYVANPIPVSEGNVPMGNFAPLITQHLQFLELDVIQG